MRKYLPHIFIISFAFFLTPAVSLADADRIFKLNNKAVVVVTAYDEKGNAISQGSGFIVRRDGAVVTNYHVISKARSIKVKAGDKVFDVEGLIYTDKENDLAILKARAKDLPVVKLGVIGEANIGEHVYVIGNPSGLENTISVGLLRGIRKIDEKREILRTTTPILPGSSGGPVFNREGEVVGVVTKGVFSETRPSSTAIPVKLIKDKISSKRVTAIKESGLEDYINTAGYWCRLGNYSYYAGMHKEAIESYKQAIMIDPDDANLHCLLGEAYNESGMYKKAIEACKQVIRIDPDLARAHLALARAYGMLGKTKEAIESFKQVIRIDPDNAQAHLTIGLSHYDSGRHKEAIEAGKRAIEAGKQEIKIYPDYAMAHYYLGLAYLLLNDRDSALEQSKILESLDPKRANALFNMIYK